MERPTASGGNAWRGYTQLNINSTHRQRRAAITTADGRVAGSDRVSLAPDSGRSSRSVILRAGLH